MKVYGVFKSEMMMPFLHETIVDVYALQEKADEAVAELNLNNKDPMEEDDYGPMRGCKYFTAELEVK